MEIHIPDDYTPHKLSDGNGYQGYRPKECNAKEVSIDLQQEHQKKVYGVSPVNFFYPVCPPYFPVCPVLKKMISEEKRNSLPDNLKTTTPLLDSILKILFVFAHLIKLKPDEETIVRWAHSENLLKERLDPIWSDVLSLPQFLEKDFPNTSKECEELVAELKFAQFQYSMQGQSLVYLLPDNLMSGNWATFLQWREQQRNLASDESTRIELCRLTRHYPAEAIKVMLNFGNKIASLVEVLIKKAKADKQITYTILENVKMYLKLSADLTSEQNKDAGTDAKQKGKAKSRVKPLPEEAIQAYQLRNSIEFRGKTLEELAGIMNGKLVRNDIKPYTITRWTQRVEKYLNATGLPIASICTKPDEIPIDPDKINMGERTDGITPRQRPQKSDDDQNDDTDADGQPDER
jgi:hypothetical protein